jgi:16S rRNA (guanine(527)-N(7))-methyltransferase RsmG
LDDESDRIEKALRLVFESAGESLPECLASLVAYTAELERWNRRFHLTGFKTAEEIADMGIYSCGRLARHLGSGERIVDVGSGNGLPGLVLAALVPSSDFTLVEKSAMRASFLKTTAGAMGVRNAAVLTGKVESMEGRGLFDAALSMAVFRPPLWLEVGAGIVRPGGRVFLLHAGRGGREALPDPPGTLELVEEESYALPLSGHSRGIAVYRRTT